MEVGQGPNVGCSAKGKKKAYRCCVKLVYFEGLYLLEYNVMYSIKIKLMFRRNMPPPSSGPKNKPSKKPV
jgi:hypothetical protein